MFYGKEIDMWSLGCIVFMLLGGYAPFYACQTYTLFERISRGIFKFHPQYWDGISPAAKDLITGLFAVDGAKRLTIDQALGHEWFKQDFQFPNDVTLSSLEAFKEQYNVADDATTTKRSISARDPSPLMLDDGNRI